MHRRLGAGDERRRTATRAPSSPWHETRRQLLNRDLQQVDHQEILNERAGWIIDGKTNDILEDDTVDTVEGIKLEVSQRAHGNVTYSTRSCRNMEELYDSDDFTDSISNLGAIKPVSSVSSGSRYTAHLLQRRSRAGSSSGSLSSSPKPTSENLIRRRLVSQQQWAWGRFLACSHLNRCEPIHEFHTVLGLIKIRCRPGESRGKE